MVLLIFLTKKIMVSCVVNSTRSMRFVPAIEIYFSFSGAREDLHSVHDKFSYTHVGSCKVGSPSYAKCTKSAVQTSPFHNEHDQHCRPYNLLLEASIIVP